MTFSSFDQDHSEKNVSQGGKELNGSVDFGPLLTEGHANSREKITMNWCMAPELEIREVYIQTQNIDLWSIFYICLQCLCKCMNIEGSTADQNSEYWITMI